MFKQINIIKQELRVHTGNKGDPELRAKVDSEG